MFDKDRRKYPRANYQCQLTMWMTNGSNETILANTTNIGLGGLCVHLNQGIGIGAKTDIILIFNGPTPAFKCQGVVVRSQKGDGKSYDIGVQFDPLNESQQTFLDGKIAEILDQEKKGKS